MKIKLRQDFPGKTMQREVFYVIFSLIKKEEYDFRKDFKNVHENRILVTWLKFKYSQKVWQFEKESIIKSLEQGLLQLK